MGEIKGMGEVSAAGMEGEKSIKWHKHPIIEVGGERRNNSPCSFCAMSKMVLFCPASQWKLRSDLTKCLNLFKMLHLVDLSN